MLWTALEDPDPMGISIPPMTHHHRYASARRDGAAAVRLADDRPVVSRSR
jgi:hypothetical protein